jgi:aldehyde dehydrogenase family 7 protein A1
VYGWNLAIAMITGNSTIWKPSPTTPLCAIAVTRLIQPVLERNGLPGAVAALVCGDVAVGKELVGSSAVDMGELRFCGLGRMLTSQSASPGARRLARK